jgi:hypothetical protein
MNETSNERPDLTPGQVQRRAQALVQSMPAHLKDPANYEKIRKVILEALAGGHSHGEMMEWAACAICQRRFFERRDVLKKLGFRNAAQYMAWQKIHEEIKTRVKFNKYNTA